MLRRFACTLVTLSLFLVQGGSQDTLQNNQSAPDPLQNPPAAVLYEGDTLFFLFGSLGPFSPADRADAFTRRLAERVADAGFNSDRFSVGLVGAFTVIRYDNTPLLSITSADVAPNGVTPDQGANEYLQVIVNATSSQDMSLIEILRIVGIVALVIAILLVIIWLLNKGLNVGIRRVEAKSEGLIDRFKLRKYRFLSVDRQMGLLFGVLRIVKLILLLIFMYLLLPVVFYFLPIAEGITETLINYVTRPIKAGFKSIVEYIPKLITIVVVIVFMRAMVRMLRSFSNEVANGKIEIRGFYPDWAMPTFNLLRFILYVFTFVLIFPLLPGSGSAVFQGVSVFLGLLISLGSQSAISNIIAGLVITYMRAFRVGDRVRIGSTTGDVLERSMLVTRVRTIKNEEVTIPNSEIMTSHTVNYTVAEGQQGLILNTTVTIGYDVPWREVRQLLIDAALKTPLIKDNPSPFVLQTSLDDYYVSYQLNAYTAESAVAAKTYSKLHANIQDTFNEAAVEIMSPHYRVNRQILDSTVVENFKDGPEPEDI